MRASLIVQQSLGTPTELSLGSCCTPWHPWFGLRVGVHEAIEKSDDIVFRCNLSGSDAERWLEIPAWMFDQSACARVRVVADAHADLAALTVLAALLRHVLNDRFASSYAPFSGASHLSRDENRGEVHATPDQADAGAPSHAVPISAIASETRDLERRDGTNLARHRAK